MNFRRALLTTAIAILLFAACPALAQVPWESSPTPSGDLSFTPAKIVNVEDYQWAGGAKCDGVTDDTSAVDAAEASPIGPITIPGWTTLCKTTIPFLSTPATVGPGRLIGSDGNYRAPNNTNLSAPPAAFGSATSASTLFNGDLRQVASADQKEISGATTLGQPTSGYLIYPEAANKIYSVVNSSGYNYSASGNAGRTGLEAEYVLMTQNGYGDMNSRYCTGTVNSTQAGATSYLASPEIACYGGSLFSTVDHAYVEFLGDQNITDNGHDIAAAWGVSNLFRTNATEGLGAFWSGLKIFSGGSAPIDVGLLMAGPMIDPIDLSGATISTYVGTVFTLTPGGTNYCVGEGVSVSGGTLITNGPVTSFTVTNTSGGSGPGNCGSVLAGGLTLVNHGMYSVPPVTSNAPLTITTTGSGTGLALAGQYENNTAIVLPAGGGCIRPNQVTGSPPVTFSGVNNSICDYQNGMFFGGLNGTVNATSGAGNVAFGDHYRTIGQNSFGFGIGYYDDNARLNGAYFSSGDYANQSFGQSQTAWFIFRGVGVAGAGAIRLTSDDNAAAANNTYSIPVSSIQNVFWICSAFDVTTPANTAAWRLQQGVINRLATGNVAAYQGDGATAVTATWSTGTGATATVTFAADVTNESLSALVIPPTSGDTWRAHCEAQILQLTGS